jgi:hypothetical protein
MMCVCSKSNKLKTNIIRPINAKERNRKDARQKLYHALADARFHNSLNAVIGAIRKIC